MILILGLGNPGKDYEKTRHNAGFMFLDALASKYSLSFSFNKKFNAQIVGTSIEGEDIIFVKPQTYMNLSGNAALKIANYYKIPAEKIWVIYDDVDLTLGKIRTRQSGSSGGHKGIDSIIDNLNNDNFFRIRIGIKTESLDQIPTDKYVLGKLTKAEQEIINTSFNKLFDLIISFIKDGPGNISA